MHNETENIINHKNYKINKKQKNETVQVSNYTNLWNQNKKLKIIKTVQKNIKKGIFCFL